MVNLQTLWIAIVLTPSLFLGPAVFRCIHDTTRTQKPFGVPGLAQIGDDYPPGLFLGM